MGRKLILKLFIRMSWDTLFAEMKIYNCIPTKNAIFYQSVRKIKQAKKNSTLYPQCLDYFYIEVVNNRLEEPKGPPKGDVCTLDVFQQGS